MRRIPQERRIRVKPNAEGSNQAFPGGNSILGVKFQIPIVGKEVVDVAFHKIHDELNIGGGRPGRVVNLFPTSWSVLASLPLTRFADFVA
jgi:hypothetical protein